MLKRLLIALLACALGVASLPAQTTVVDLPNVVVSLPGIGQGWLDTLRAIAGPAAVDTLPSGMKVLRYNGVPYPVGGWYDNTNDVIHINGDTSVYTWFASQITRQGTHQHPIETANPAGVLAHEFGHRFQLRVLLPANGVRESGDTLPTWAQGDAEVFADRFAMALLAIRTPKVKIVPTRGNNVPVAPPEPTDPCDPLQAILLALLRRNLP